MVPRRTWPIGFNYTRLFEFLQEVLQEKSTVLGQRAILRIATCNLGGSVLLAVIVGVVGLRKERRAKLVVGIGVEEQSKTNLPFGTLQS